MYTQDHKKRMPEAPLWLSRIAERQFRRLEFRTQMFIYMRYVLHREKTYIMKYLFIKSEKTYYHLLNKTKDIIYKRYTIQQ